MPRIGLYFRSVENYLTLFVILIVAGTSILLVYWTHQSLKNAWQTIIDNDLKLKNLELKKEAFAQTLSVRLQAYERLVLLLERSKVTHLLNRLSEAGMPASVLYHALVTSLRAELEHNLSQQVYVGSNSWSALMEAHQSMLNLVNACYQACPEGASHLDLARLLFENESTTESLNKKAIELLKKEALPYIG